jgi:putrescine transport system substrate-binding protein
MKMKFVQLFATAAVSALLASGVCAEDRVLNIYNWSDYIDPAILEEFTKETGIKVVYDVYDSNEMLETKVLAGGSGYDIVVPSANFLQRQVQAGVFQELDKSKLPNFANMWDMINTRVAAYDPGNAHSIDYMWGTTGIGYNVAKMKEITGSDEKPTWDTVFKPENLAKFKECGVTFMDAPQEMISAALNYLGLDPNSGNKEDLAKAEELFLSIRPSIRKFTSSAYIEGLANGDICLALGYSGDVFQARNRAKEANNGVAVEYAIPPQGAQMWFDLMAIPADAPHVAEAHEFLNYMMRPEVIAKASNFVFYANGNKASQPLLDKAVLEDTAIYPPEETMNKLYGLAALDAKTQKLYTRLWTKVMTGQ